MDDFVNNIDYQKQQFGSELDINDQTTNLSGINPIVNTANHKVGVQLTDNSINKSYSFSDQNIVDNTTNFSSGVGGGMIKLVIMLIIPITAMIFTGVFFRARADERVDYQSRGVVMKIPMKDTNWKDIGSVFEPIIVLPIRAQGKYHDWEFLLDSGAVISSLPRDWADKMGQDIDKMKRSVFKGFGSTMSFAYQGEMTVLIGEDEVLLPVVFTENTGTKSLIGRRVFFQDYSVFFDHKNKVIEIIK